MADLQSLSVLSEIPLDLDDRLQWLLDREQELADIIARDLSRVIETVYDEFLATLSEPEQIDAIVASGDIEQLGDIVPRWRMAIGRNIQPYLEQVYLSGGVSAYLSAPGTKGFTETQAGQWADVVNQVAVDYSRQMTNRLVGVGETAWKMIRSKVTKAIKSGASNEVLRNELINVRQFSEFRADVIARTEVQFAYSNGNWQAGQALGQYGPLEKEWLATSDARTRRSHASINGTRLPIGEPFQMSSGAQMMYPHDPSAPARETVQCRCVLLEYYAGDVRPDGSIVGEAAPGQEAVIQPEMAEQSTVQAVQTQRQAGLPPGKDFTSQSFIDEALSTGVTASRVSNAEEMLTLLNTVNRMPEVASGEKTAIRFSSRRKGSNGSFHPLTRGPKPTRGRYKPTSVYQDEINEFRQRVPAPEVIVADTQDLAGQAFTMVHEFGHRIDFDDLTTTDVKKMYRSQRAWRSGDTYLLQKKHGKKWTDHIDEIKDPEINAFLNIAKVALEAQSTAKYLGNTTAAYKKYYTSIHEIWARAYSQWVAETTQHPKLMEGLTRRVTGGGQFSPEEFALLKPHIETVLRVRGLI